MSHSTMHRFKHNKDITTKTRLYKPFSAKMTEDNRHLYFFLKKIPQNSVNNGIFQKTCINSTTVNILNRLFCMAGRSRRLMNSC